MEHWLQLMCCALAVVLVPYFGEVGGRLRKDKREDEELLKSIFKLLYSGVYILQRNIALITEAEQMSKLENRMYSNWNCAPEGRKPERCTQHRGIYKAELILILNKAYRNQSVQRRRRTGDKVWRSGETDCAR